MSKVNNLSIRYNIMRRCRALKLAFNNFKDAVANLKKFSAEDEALIKLTLDNLLNEINTATKVVKERSGK